MQRRAFLRRLTLGTGGLAWAGRIPGWATQAQGFSAAKELSADLVIIGGGVGGVAAALAGCRAGLQVILTEETNWIGGQLTAQAVPPDEHRWIESHGCTRSYRRFRDGVRAYYRDHFPLTTAARLNPLLNPGNGWVSRLCHEPRVALAVLEQMLAPYLASGRLGVLLETVPRGAEVDGDWVKAIKVQDLRAGEERVLRAPFFIDATELGDLLPFTRTEFVTGGEARRDTGEEHAGESADPLDQQGITACFALDYLPGEEHLIERPAEYEFWRSYAPRLTPPYAGGRLLAWTSPDPATLKPRELICDPTEKAEGRNLWTYRRIADPAQFVSGTYASAISLVNWPQNDFWLGPLVGPGVTDADRSISQARARQLSLSLVYWMQTEAPRPDGGTGWKGLRLRNDVVGTRDGLAKTSYIREARRIRAEFTVTENHVGTEARQKVTGQPRDEVTAATFGDSVGVGAYRIDLHPGTSGRNYVDLSSLPFQIPLGALLPQRVENLLPACKNLGVTHITNGCYRLHPVEWNIGEAAGALVAFSRERKVRLRQVRSDAKLLAEFQQRLRSQGFELEWPRTGPL